MAIYKIELCGGRVGLIESKSIKSAQRRALREEGSSNVVNVTRASADDIAWVKGMGGAVS